MRTLVLLMTLALPMPAFAQNPTPAIPDRVDILVIGPGMDPNTAAPTAQRTTSINPNSANCNISTLPQPPQTPLVNPTKGWFDDPFESNRGKYCWGDLPTNLPPASGYQAVAIFYAPSCTKDGVTLTPCPSPRSSVGVPPFNIQTIINQPAAPTGLAVRP